VFRGVQRPYRRLCNNSWMKMLMFAVLFAFTAQILSAQSPNTDPCPVPQMLGAVGDPLPCPTPTPPPPPPPTPSPTPTPTPGALGPKYRVVTVAYPPPGSESHADYGNSTMRGSTSSLNHSFTTNTSWSVSLQASHKFEIFGVGVDGSITGNFSHEVEQVAENSSSIT